MQISAQLSPRFLCLQDLSGLEPQWGFKNQLSNWADDNPDSPANRMGRSHSGALLAHQGAHIKLYYPHSVVSLVLPEGSRPISHDPKIYKFSRQLFACSIVSATVSVSNTESASVIRLMHASCVKVMLIKSSLLQDLGDWMAGCGQAGLRPTFLVFALVAL